MEEKSIWEFKIKNKTRCDLRYQLFCGLLLTLSYMLSWLPIGQVKLFSLFHIWKNKDTKELKC